jgi:rhodanese-related sulfurtransferase
MRKISTLILIAMLVGVFVPVSPVAAQEAVPEVVLDRIEEYGELIPELEHYNTVRVDAFTELLIEDPDLVVVDVREDAELEETGTIEDAIHIPIRTLGENLDLLPDLDATMVIVCKGGFRATIAMTALHVLGYENAYVLVGGFSTWADEGMPVVEEAAMVEAGEMPDIDEELVEYVAEYLAELPEGFGGVGANALFEEMFETMPDSLIDVRSDEEWADPGYIDGAEHLWINEFIQNMDQWPAEKDANIVVYCASGYRGNIAATVMGLLGYENVRNMSGGVNAWVAEGLPLVMS